MDRNLLNNNLLHWRLSLRIGLSRIPVDRFGQCCPSYPLLKETGQRSPVWSYLILSSYESFLVSLLGRQGNAKYLTAGVRFEFAKPAFNIQWQFSEKQSAVMLRMVPVPAVSDRALTARSRESAIPNRGFHVQPSGIQTLFITNETSIYLVKRALFQNLNRLATLTTKREELSLEFTSSLNQSALVLNQSLALMYQQTIWPILTNVLTLPEAGQQPSSFEYRIAVATSKKYILRKGNPVLRPARFNMTIMRFASVKAAELRPGGISGATGASISSYAGISQQPINLSLHAEGAAPVTPRERRRIANRVIERWERIAEFVSSRFSSSKVSMRSILERNEKHSDHLQTYSAGFVSKQYQRYGIILINMRRIHKDRYPQKSAKQSRSKFPIFHSQKDNEVITQKMTVMSDLLKPVARGFRQGLPDRANVNVSVPESNVDVANQYLALTKVVESDVRSPSRPNHLRDTAPEDGFLTKTRYNSFSLIRFSTLRMLDVYSTMNRRAPQIAGIVQDGNGRNYKSRMIPGSMFSNEPGNVAGHDSRHFQLRQVWQRKPQSGPVNIRRVISRMHRHEIEIMAKSSTVCNPEPAIIWANMSDSLALGIESTGILIHKVEKRQSQLARAVTGTAVNYEDTISPAAGVAVEPQFTNEFSHQNNPVRFMPPAGIASLPESTRPLMRRDMAEVAEEVYTLIEKKLRLEGESRGMFF